MSISEDIPPDLNWRKAKRSISNGACVEVAVAAAAVAIRDSKNPDGEILRYSLNSWRSFIGGARMGCLDELGR
jgi:uncharacterized protein YmfQ (DUF2313 family)